MPKKVEIYTTDPEFRQEVQEAIDKDSVYFALTKEEIAVLKKMLDRDRTSREVHGGLKGLFVLSDEEATTLLGFLDRVTK